MNQQRKKNTLLERNALAAKDSRGESIKVGKGFRTNDLSEQDLKEQEATPTPEEQIEDGWSQQEQQHYIKTRLGQATMIVLSLLLTAGIWAFLNLPEEEATIIKQRAQEIAHQKHEVAKIAEQKSQQAANVKLCVKNYLEARNKEDRAVWCRNPAVTLFKMTQHQNRGNTFKRYQFTGELEFSEVDLDGRPMILANAQCLSDAKEAEQEIERTPLLLEAQTNGSYGVDWETAVVYQPDDWDLFISTRSSEPQTFRVEVIDRNNQGPYLNQFSDDHTFQAYRINIRDNPDKYLIAYAKKDSAIDLKLKETLEIDVTKKNTAASRFSAPMILKLAYPTETDSEQCVEIVEIISAIWFKP